jgi:hypothetical protein
MKMIRLRCALALALALACSAHAFAAARPTVVELYTSEGCSSCPPADQLLGTLADRPDVLALAFHVRYWDNLGWPDRFGLAYADQRQGIYAQRLNLASVFTPQLIIEGQRSFIGSDQRGILALLGVSHQGVAIGIAAQGEQLRIDLAAGEKAATADVLLLALLPEAQTAIGRGENGGRTLREVNVVRASFVLGGWNGSTHSYSLPRAALPTDATEVAVLVQQQGQRTILGASLAALR